MFVGCDLNEKNNNFISLNKDLGGNSNLDITKWVGEQFGEYKIWDYQK